MRLAGASLLIGLGCATPGERETDGRRFRFARDTFAYTNDLYWDYAFREDGATVARDRNRPAEYGQRCSIMARAARQFFYNARFAPDAPAVSDVEYRALVRAVLESDPRGEAPSAHPVIIPGHPDLRSFSGDQERALKEELGGRLAAYLQRGNWRIVYPFAPRQQRATARDLIQDLRRGHPPIVHLVNFPRIDINHTLLLFGFEENPLAIHFLAYDPNDAKRPVNLVFDRATASFHLAQTAYFAGGPVKLFEIYDGVFF